MNGPQIDLDIVYHVECPMDFIKDVESRRYWAAADWIASQFQLTELTASIAIVDDVTIQKVNRQHLEHDWPTDVVSLVFEQRAGVVEGEIIASIETAARLASTMGWSAGDELLLYVVHGLLHLAGLDDVAHDQSAKMRQMEQACLLALDVPRASAHGQRFDFIFNEDESSQ
jgi:probable rRNA maturation factor